MIARRQDIMFLSKRLLVKRRVFSSLVLATGLLFLATFCPVFLNECLAEASSQVFTENEQKERIQEGTWFSFQLPPGWARLKPGKETEMRRGVEEGAKHAQGDVSIKGIRVYGDSADRLRVMVVQTEIVETFSLDEMFRSKEQRISLLKKQGVQAESSLVSKNGIQAILTDVKTSKGRMRSYEIYCGQQGMQVSFIAFSRADFDAHLKELSESENSFQTSDRCRANSGYHSHGNFNNRSGGCPWNCSRGRTKGSGVFSDCGGMMKCRPSPLRVTRRSNSITFDRSWLKPRLLNSP